MLPRFVAALILLFVSGSAFSQAAESNYLHNRTIMERVPLAGQAGNAIVLGNLTVSAPATVGDVYLTKDYRITTFWLYDENRVAQGYASRLDLQRNEFDIYMGKGNGIKALAGTRVRTLVMADSLTKTPQYFVNGQEYKDKDGIPYVGFFQILSEGELTLLKMTRVTFKPADHNPTHYTGSKDNRFIKRTDIYYATATNALELPNRKGILKLMESHKDEVEKFMKVNEINITIERHLVALFDYYNSLTKKK
ncbi:MAG: hypothetical protein JNN04_14700 [Cyclobacteriaceae bacterium]|nr:hypothetical protein [Cyclobacteriaceae bacterium]